MVISMDAQDLSAVQSTVLKAFSHALGREEPVLVSHPEIIWQQLYNRLQWADEPNPRVLAPELGRSRKPGAATWMKNKKPSRESNALIRTLTGHTGTIDACPISPDGSFIVFGSEDETLKLWDAACGWVLYTLSGHTNWVNTVAFSSDGVRIATASYDRTLIVGDTDGKAHIFLLCENKLQRFETGEK
jgi:WD40 repeat protein